MIVTTPILEKHTAKLTPEELISYLTEEFKSQTPRPYHCFVAKIKESAKDEVVNHFLEKGYDIKVYTDSDYVQFKSDGKGTLTKCGYPYAYELAKKCEEKSLPILVYDDEDSKDIHAHFNVEYSVGGTELFKKVDMNDLLTYLIEEKGYKSFYSFTKFEKGECIIKKDE